MSDDVTVTKDQDRGFPVVLEETDLNSVLGFSVPAATNDIEKAVYAVAREAGKRGLVITCERLCRLCGVTDPALDLVRSWIETESPDDLARCQDWLHDRFHNHGRLWRHRSISYDAASKVLYATLKSCAAQEDVARTTPRPALQAALAHAIQAARSALRFLYKEQCDAGNPRIKALGPDLVIPKLVAAIEMTLDDPRLQAKE